jgi:hypothetical protein
VPRPAGRAAAARLALVLAALAPWPAAAEIQLPPGFTATVHITGDGFDSSTERRAQGIPSTATIRIDEAGYTYLARTGRRYTQGGEVDDLWPIYRFPPGGGRMTTSTESRFFYGPPLPSPQVAALRGREVLVTTYDRDRKVGVLYRINDGRAEYIAGGRAAPGQPPLFVQPEGAAVDSTGGIVVADRGAGVLVRLDRTGRALDSPTGKLLRPRLVAFGEGDRLWIAVDGEAEAPWQRGPGEILLLEPGQAPRSVLKGPVVSAMALGPAGHLFIADRVKAEIFALREDGTRVPVIKFTDQDAPRSLAFVPVTPATQRAGIAGNLFVVAIGKGTWPINEVVRISGPFEELVRGR